MLKKTHNPEVQCYTYKLTMKKCYKCCRTIMTYFSYCYHQSQRRLGSTIVAILDSGSQLSIRTMMCIKTLQLKIINRSTSLSFLLIFPIIPISTTSKHKV